MKKKDIFKWNRDELITTFNKCIDLVSERITIENKCETLEQEMETIPYSESSEINTLLDKKINKVVKLCRLVLIVLYVFITKSMFSSATSDFSALIGFIMCEVFIFYIGKFILFVLKFIIEKLVSAKFYRNPPIEYYSIKEKYADRLKEIKKIISKLQKDKLAIQTEIDKIDLGDLHEHYRDMYIFSNFIEYLQKGRCDNLRECINLYEDELSKQQMYENIVEENKKMEQKLYKCVENNNRMIENKLNNINSDLKEVRVETEINKQRHEDYVIKYGNSSTDRKEEEYRRKANQKVNR